MRDLSETWSSPPDWARSVLDVPELKIRSVLNLEQHLVGGNLAAWSRMSGLDGQGVGAFGVAEKEPCCIRLSRDQLLVVGQELTPVRGGWYEGGYAVTDIGAGLHVFEISGLFAPAVIARGTALHPHSESPCASLLFAGVSAAVYRHTDSDTWRIHVDRALAAYLWTWFRTVAPR